MGYNTTMFHSTLEDLFGRDVWLKIQAKVHQKTPGRHLSEEEQILCLRGVCNDESLISAFQQLREKYMNRISPYNGDDLHQLYGMNVRSLLGDELFNKYNEVLTARLNGVITAMQPAQTPPRNLSEEEHIMCLRSVCKDENLIGKFQQ